MTLLRLSYSLFFIAADIHFFLISSRRELRVYTHRYSIQSDICFIRRLKRDIKQRGRSMESVIEQYNATVRPMFLQFIEPSKQHADIIVPRGGKNRIAADILKSRIRYLLG